MDNAMEESKKEDIESLKKAVKDKKLRWKPKETPIAKKDKKKRKDVLGALLDKEEEERIIKQQEAKKKKI